MRTRPLLYILLILALASTSFADPNLVMRNDGAVGAEIPETSLLDDLGVIELALSFGIDLRKDRASRYYTVQFLDRCLAEKTERQCIDELTANLQKYQAERVPDSTRNKRVIEPRYKNGFQNQELKRPNNLGTRQPARKVQRKGKF